MSVFDMIKNIYKKNSAQKQTADSSKTVSRPAVKTTSSNDGAKNRNTNTQKSEASYWQATQQTQNQQSTQKAKQQMSLPKTQKATRQTANKRDKESADKAQKYAEAQKKARSYNPEKQYDYRQANAGLEELFKNPIKALNGGSEKAMRRYYDANRKLVKHDIQRRQKQAEAAQAQVDLTKEALEQHPDLKAWSDLGLSTLGGLTSGVGGLLKTGTTLARGIAGATGNRDTEKKLRQWEADLGVEQALQNVNENNLVANNMMGQVAQSVGNMIPTIAANALTGGGAGLGVMGASVFGNEGSEALNRLASDGRLTREDAVRGLTTGALKAGLEVGSESITGFIPGLETFAFTNPNNLLGQAGGEALEEMFSSAIEPVIDPMADPNVRRVSDYAQTAYNNTFGNASQYGRDIAQSGLLGAATSLAMGVPANIIANQQATAETPEPAQTEEQRRVANELAKTINETEVDERRNSFVPQFGQSSDYTLGTQGIPFDQLYAQQFDENAELPVPPVTPQAEPLTDTEGVAPEYLPSELTPSATEVNEKIPSNTLKASKAYKPKYKGESYDMSYEDYVAHQIRNAEITPTPEQTVEPVVRPLTKKQQADVAYTGREETVAPATDIPEDMKAIVDGEDTITDAEYYPNEKLGDTLEFVPQTTEEVKKVVFPEGSEEANTPEAEGVSEAILADINEAHQALTAVPKNETTPSGTAMSEAYGTMIDDFEARGDTYNAEKMKKNPEVGTYKTIKNADLLRSADEVYRDVGIDGMRDIILRPELLENKGVSGMMITYCNKYSQEAKVIRDNYIKDNNLTYDKGKWMQNGTEISEDSDIYKKLHEMDEQNWKVVQATVQYRSNAGYALQACKLMNEISPEYRIEKMNQWIEGLNNDIHKDKSGRKHASIDLITESEKTSYLNAKTDVERAEILKSIEDRVKAEMPAEFSERMSQWRYLMMLANPTTHVRNIMGNVLMQGLTSAKNAITYGIEKVAYQSRRFTSQIDLNNAGDVAIKNYADNAPFKQIETEFNEYLEKGLHKASRSKRIEFWKSKGYSGKTLNYLARGTRYALDTVTKGRWANSLANIIKQGGYTVNTDGKLIDSTGKVLDNTELRKLTQEGYEDSLKHYVDSSQFSRTNEQGKAVFTNKVADKALFDFADDYFYQVADSEKSKDAGKWNANGSSPTSNVFQKTRSKFFNKTLGKGIDWIANKNNKLLDVEDRAFTKTRFRSEFATQLKLNGYTVEDGVLMKDGKAVDMESKELLAMQEYAYEEALESVFRDTNRLAKTLAKMRNWNAFSRYTIDAIMPFTTTPMNITKRISEYSPIGFTRGLWDTLHSVEAGTVDPQTAINRLARGTTGTGLMLIGAFLASIGRITGKGEDDDRVDRYENSLNINKEYAWQFADGHYYTLDWAAPSGAILLLGATMHDRLRGLKLTEGDDFTHNAQTVMDWLLSSGATVLDPVMDMTVLSGVQDLFEGYAQGDKELEGVIQNVLKSFAGQFTPTVGAKINKIIDNTKRTTYSDTWIDSVVRQNMNKIPMMSALLEPALDYKGNTLTNTVYDTGNDVANKVIDTAYYMLSPGNYSSDVSTSYDKELIKVARESGNSYITPTTFSYLTNQYNEKFKFTPKERTELNQYYAQTYKAEIEKFMNSDSYSVYDENGKEGILEKSKIMDSIQRHVYNMTKEKYFSKVTPEADSSLYASDIAAEKMKDMGMDYYQFYEMKAIKGDKDSEGETIPLSGAIHVRNYLENQGIYDDIVKAIKDGTIEPKDVNLTKTVVGWNATEYEGKYEELMDNLANESYKVSKKSSSKSSSKSSGGSSSRSTGSTRSYSRSSGVSSSGGSTGSDPVEIATSILNHALTQAKRNTTGIQTKLNASGSSAQALYNSVMSEHNSNLSEAKKYTTA